jgi:hypothetical protein
MPRVPIQTGKKTFVDSFGNTHDWTHTSALGPIETVVRPEPKPITDASTNPCNFRPPSIGVDGQPILDAASDNHPLNQRHTR